MQLSTDAKMFVISVFSIFYKKKRQTNCHISILAWQVCLAVCHNILTVFFFENHYYKVKEGLQTS